MKQYILGSSAEAKYRLEVYKELSEWLNGIKVREVNEEPVSNDLEEAARKAELEYPVPKKDGDMAEIFIAGAKWQKENLWKDAQGDDLPEVDREVIVLYQPYPCEGNEYVVSFAYRPPERWYGRNLDEEEHVFEPKTYDKGEWNIPNVVWWLDLDLPIKVE